jgi:hypothetical protein
MIALFMAAGECEPGQSVIVKNSDGAEFECGKDGDGSLFVNPANEIAAELISQYESDNDEDDDSFDDDENVCPVCDGVGDLEETCSECYYCQGAGYL